MYDVAAAGAGALRDGTGQRCSAAHHCAAGWWAGAPTQPKWCLGAVGGAVLATLAEGRTVWRAHWSCSEEAWARDSTADSCPVRPRRAACMPHMSQPHAAIGATLRCLPRVRCAGCWSATRRPSPAGLAQKWCRPSQTGGLVVAAGLSCRAAGSQQRCLGSCRASGLHPGAACVHAMPPLARVARRAVSRLLRWHAVSMLWTRQHPVVPAALWRRCFWSLEAPPARVCGYDTPFPLVFEPLYLPTARRVADAIRRTVAAT